MIGALLVLATALVAAAPPPGEGRIAGCVVDQEGVTVPSGIPVVAEAGASRSLTFTDPEGKFVLEGLDEGPFTLSAGEADSDFPVVRHPVEVRPGTGDVRLAVVRGWSFSGRIRLPSWTRAFAGELILRIPGSPDPVARAAPREGRTFSFRGIPARKAAVSVLFEGAEIPCGEFDLPAAGVDVDVAIPKPPPRSKDPPKPKQDPPGSIRIGRELFRPGPITCRVTDARGAPLPGAAIAIHLLDTTKPSDRAAAEPSAKGTSDADGAFITPELPAGLYEVRVRLKGWKPASQNARTGPAAEFRLDPGLSIRGVALDKETGEPLPGIEVRVERESDGMYGGSGRTAADGTFEAGYGAPGLYSVAFGFTGRHSSPGVNLPRDVLPFRVHNVEHGTEDLRVEIPRGLALGGRLTLPGGNPLPAESLKKLSAGLSTVDGEGRMNHYTLCGVSIDETGAFRVGSLQPGRYALDVQYQDRESNHWIHFEPFVLDAGAIDLRLVIPLGAPVEGRVLDGAGKPFPAGTGVFLVEQGPLHQDTGSIETVADGTFRTGPLDSSKIYDAYAVVRGFTPAVAPDVRAGMKDLLLVPGPAASIEGRAVDVAGDPIPAGIGLQAFPVPCPERLQRVAGNLVQTGEGGTFRFDGLFPGMKYTLFPNPGADYLPTTASTLVASGTGGILLVLRKACTFSGRVLGADGKPLPWVMVRIMPVHRGDLPAWMAFGGTCDDDGNFKFAGLPPGPALLRAEHGKDTWDLGTVDLPSTGEGRVFTLK